MNSIHNIMQELNESNSSKYKIEVLTKYIGSEELQRVLQI
jgi:hypothetical protein